MRKERVKALCKTRKDDKYFILISFPSGISKKIEVDEHTFKRTLTVEGEINER